MKSSSSQSVVVHFVAICMFPINMCTLLLPSDTAKISLTACMDATMGLRTELCFHKAEMFLTAEDGFVFLW